MKKCAHCANEGTTMISRGIYACADHLSLYETCSDCNKLVLRNEFITIETSNGPKKVCAKCAKEYVKCSFCGYSVKKTDAVKLSNGKYVCSSHEGYYAVDAITGEFSVRTDMREFRADNGELVYSKNTSSTGVPSSITSQFPANPNYSDKWEVPFAGSPFIRQCPVCGEYHIISKVARGMGNRKFVCYDCFMQKKLLACGHVVPIGYRGVSIPRVFSPLRVPDVDGCFPVARGQEDSSSLLDPGTEVCSSCAEQHSVANLSKNVSFVLNYSYAPTPLFKHRVPGDEASPLMGFELEVDKGSSSAESTASAVLSAVGRKHVYCKSDGSLKGESFEQVTHPATIDYYLSERERYEKLLSIPKAAGFVSHDSGDCGLHVHVDRGYFSEGERDIGIRKVLFLTEKFYPEIFIFSRRDPASAQTWAKRWLPAMDGALLSAKDIATAFESKMGDGDRRKLVNLQKEPTLEFRIFRGSLNPTTFWATLQLVNNIVCVAKNTELENLDAVTWLDIVKFREFPELNDYNTRRVGEGWSGDEAVKTFFMSDKGEVKKDDVKVPDAISPKKLQFFKGYKFRANNQDLVALWDGIGDRLHTANQGYVDARRQGDRIIITPTPEAKFKVSNGALVRVDMDEERPCKWIIVHEGFLATLPVDLSSRLISAADQVFSCLIA